MILSERIELMARLGNYMTENGPEWQQAKEQAERQNGWFTQEFIQHAAGQIADKYLQKDKLEQWAAHYHIDDNISPVSIGIIMAGNIPMVGFHDLLSIFISGHYQTIRLSSKDDVLIRHLVKVLYDWDNEIRNHISFAEMLKGCDAYIATGSDNSAKAFEDYFGKYPNIIRRNRTSVAVLDGSETNEELEKLSDDIHLYFGLGCRNVTKIYVPKEYDFVPLLASFKKYKYFADHHKYKNNYDYQLSLLLLNNHFYMTDGTTLLSENTGLFSPISQVWYEFYDDGRKLKEELNSNSSVQCSIGRDLIAFGEAQEPGLFNYADGVDTMEFLLGL